jgi:hypothetical protein
LADSDRSRVSVLLADVSAGLELEFLALASEYDATLTRKGYGHDEVIRDESVPTRFYTIRTWIDADAAERCHGDVELQRLTTKLYQIARVTQVVNGARRQDPTRLLLDDRRAHIEPDRRTGFDRRVKNVGGLQADRRNRRDRRLGPRRLREHPGDLDLVGAARRAREHADAAFSNFKVGAALETADGTVVTGCNIENATYGLTMCAERVAMFKALSEGHRVFTWPTRKHRRLRAARAARSCGSSAAISRSSSAISRRKVVRTACRISFHCPSMRACCKDTPSAIACCPPLPAKTTWS